MFPLACWLGLGSVASAGLPDGDAPKEKAKGGSTTSTSRTDALGDPLPAGAIMRIGSNRLRHQGSVYAVAVSPDDKIVASACNSPEDRSICYWSATTGELLRKIPLPSESGWNGKNIEFS